jgi:preprotein translocase subunit Sec61beta
MKWGLNGKHGQSTMPNSFGGLVQYYSEYKSKITIKPKIVIFLGVIIIAAVAAAKALL